MAFFYIFGVFFPTFICKDFSLTAYGLVIFPCLWPVLGLYFGWPRPPCECMEGGVASLEIPVALQVHQFSIPYSYSGAQ